MSPNDSFIDRLTGGNLQHKSGEELKFLSGTTVRYFLPSNQHPNHHPTYCMRTPIKLTLAILGEQFHNLIHSVMFLHSRMLIVDFTGVGNEEFQELYTVLVMDS